MHLPAILRQPLAASLALALGLCELPMSLSAAPSVSNCNDDGPGSLRVALSAAASGDIIDLNALNCSTITLSTGALQISVDSLALDAHVRATPVIVDAGVLSGHNNRAIVHSGRGMLNLENLGVVNAKYRGADPRGGCVLSNGHVNLGGGPLSNCQVLSVADQTAKGGGIYASGEVFAVRSTISGNRATALNARAQGGAIFAKGGFFFESATITGNAAYAPPGYVTAGGALYTAGIFGMADTTIAGNQSAVGAGLFVGTAAPGEIAQITNSTISGNTASLSVGGVLTYMPTVVTNSTIVFNTASESGFAAGVLGYNGVEFISSIVAANSAGSDFLDAEAAPISGSHNLMTLAPIAPPDTIIACPRLAPLAANGGPTPTHALLLSSPALNAGSNPNQTSGDQRFLPRTVGAATDIGAFEHQAGESVDAIFKGRFENRCE